MLTPKKKQAVMKKVQLHDQDTGSSHVQAAVLAERIAYLSEHLKTHPKDNHSRRGLIKLVSERRKHEKYALTQKTKDGAKAVKTVKKSTTKKVISKSTAKKIAKKIAKKPMAKKVKVEGAEKPTKKTTTKKK